MAHHCFKQGCELEIEYICFCLSSETYCCEFHLGTHLKVPNRTHNFDSILVEPGEGTRDAVLEFLEKEKSKKEKLKKMISIFSKQNFYNSKRITIQTLEKFDYDIQEINNLIVKISQNSKEEQDKLLNQMILQPETFK